MDFVFWQHPAIIALFAVTAATAVLAARLRRCARIFECMCVACTVAMLLTSLAYGVPYEEILLLTLAVLLLFSILIKERKT